MDSREDLYFYRLMMALQARQMSGQEIVDIIGELKAHLDDADAGPEEEFGPALELAARLAEKAVDRPYLRPLLVSVSLFLVVLISAFMFYRGVTGSETAIPLNLGSAGVVWLVALHFATRILLEDFITFGRDSDYRPGPGQAKVVSILVVGVVGATAVEAWLPTTEIFDPSVWLSGLLFVVSASWAIFEVERGARFHRIDRANPPEPAQGLVDRVTGVRGMATGIRLGRSMSRDWSKKPKP